MARYGSIVDNSLVSSDSVCSVVAINNDQSMRVSDCSKTIHINRASKEHERTKVGPMVSNSKEPLLVSSNCFSLLTSFFPCTLSSQETKLQVPIKLRTVDSFSDRIGKAAAF